MTITTLTDLAAAMPGQQILFNKDVVGSATGGGYLHSSWTVNRGTSQATGDAMPLAGAVPPTGSGEVPTSATAGALPFTNAASGKQLYLAQVMLMTAGTANFMFLYDRLVHTSGISANVATTQTINSVSIPTARDIDGFGGLLMIESYSQAGATLATATLSYTNQSGTAGRTAIMEGVFNPSFQAGEMRSCDLQSGDSGVRSVESITLSVATGAVGSFGLTIMKAIAMFDPPDALYLERNDWTDCGLWPIPNDACIAFATGLVAPANAGCRGTINLIEG
jgi:hypothetical protein